MSSTDALSLLRSGKTSFQLSFGCPILDQTTGGIRSGITEVHGEAGCGKTQLCLTLSLQCQLNEQHGGLSGGAAYVSCGEGQFPIKRLSQIASRYSSCTGISTDSFLSNVHIEHCFNIDDVQDILNNKIPTMCRTKGVRLLIVDSLAGLIRFEYDPRSVSEMKERTVFLFRFAKKLKWLSDTFKICVVVVNQATSIIRKDKGCGDSGGSKASLGLAWSHCVNSRITLSRESPFVSSSVAQAEAPSSSSSFSSSSSSSSTGEIDSKNTCSADVRGNLFDRYSVHSVHSAHSRNSISCSVTNESSKEAKPTVEGGEGNDSSHCEEDSGVFKSVRRLALVLSPSRPQALCTLRIDDGGIYGSLE